jgi:hypothetical protein
VLLELELGVLVYAILARVRVLDLGSHVLGLAVNC